MKFTTITLMLFLFVFSFNAKSALTVEEFLKLKNNANHYSGFFWKNYIPIKLTKSKQYEFCIMLSWDLTRMIKATYLKESSHLGPVEYEKVYKQFIKSRIRNGYVELDFDTIVKYFKLPEDYFASGKEVVGSFIKRGVKITDEKYRDTFKCFSLGRKGMVADKKLSLIHI